MSRTELQRLQIKLLGMPSLEWEGQSLEIRRRNVRGLFYRLAAEPKPVARSQLCLLFWPDEPELVARRNLTHLLTHLRMALPIPELVQARGEFIELENREVWCDAIEFKEILQEEIKETKQLRRAVDLYRSPFLTGFTLPNCSEFEHWVTMQQSALERIYLEALETLIRREISRQDYEQAIRDAIRYLETDDLAEEIHRKLISLYGLIGERNAALQQYERCYAVLERELGISPLPETRAVYQLILEGHTPALTEQAQDAKPKPVELPGLEVPLLGRELDMRRLEDALDQARAGKGNIVLISGEAGVGKSRLMREFAFNIQPYIRVLFGTGFPGGQSIPYKPIFDALRSNEAVLISGLSLHPVWLAEVSRLLPELRSQYPDLPAPMPSEPEEARIRLFDALSRYILALLPAAPVTLLCFDDMQWADRTTLEWLAYFGSQMPGRDCRLLILVSYREDEESRLEELRQGLERRASVTELKLTGLDEQAIGELLRHIRGQQASDDRLARRLQQATGGNPLFLVELLRTLIEEHKFDALSDVEDLPLPKGVLEAVEGRLRHLDTKSRQLLETCAVLGPELNFDLVRLTAGRGEVETMDGLGDLVARHVVEESGGTFHFSHDLTRQAVEARMSLVRRQLLHRRAGQALEKLEAGDASRMAYHFDRGGDLRKALHYYTLASQQVERLFAWQEAEKHQTRILELLQQVDPECNNAEYLAQRGKILASRAHLHFLQGHLTERDADLNAMAALAELSRDDHLRLQALHHNTRYLNLDGRYAEAIASSEAGLALGTRLNDLPASSLFLSQIGFAHYFLGQPRQALTALESALAISGSITDPERYGRIVHILGYVHFHLGNYGRSLEYQQEAYSCHQKIGDTNRMAWDMIDIGSALLQLGRYNEARSWLEKGIETARTIGALPAEANGLHYLGYWELYRGNSTGAQEILRQALSLQETLPVQHVTVGIETGVGLALLMSKDHASAQKWLERAVDHARSINMRRRLSDALIGLGMVSLNTGEFSRAGEQLREAVDVARASESSESLARGLAAMARYERMVGNLDSALTHANEAVGIAQKISAPTYEMWGELEVGAVILAQGRPNEALVHSLRALTLAAQAHEGWIAKAETKNVHDRVLESLANNENRS